ncbi:hypothetical protein H1R20_g1002, partial [Candolleomyces eurysporus]
MAPPENQGGKPRKRDRVKKFLKDPFGSRAHSPSPSGTTSHATIAGGSGDSSHAAQDEAIPSPPDENITRSEIQSNQDSIDTALGGQLRADLSRQAIQSTSSEAAPSLSAHDEENTLITPTSTFDHNAGSQVSTPFPPSGRLARSQGEGEAQTPTAHVENPIQDHGAAVVEGDLSDLSSPTQSNIPAAAEPQEGTAHVEHQPARLAAKIYEGVKTTLQKVVQAYGENKHEFNELLKRVEVLSKIMVSCPPDVSQEVKDRFDGLLRTLEKKQKILKAKVDPTRSGVERVMFAPQDKQQLLKLTQEIRFAIEIAMFDAIIENKVHTLQIVSGVDWLKDRINGTGKTTVSKSFCSQLDDRGLLGATFFCTLTETDKRDVYLIIPTLARILAEERPTFGDALEEILESDGSCRNPTEMKLKDQYLKLILLPAQKTFAADELLVLGVDALDECKDQNAVRLFIAAIMSQKPTIPLKFFLTSRPETSLRESFESSTHHGWLRLHDIEADIVRADILLYLNDQLKCIPGVYDHYQANWPPPEIQTLVNVSGTLFIIAATMAAYISTSSGNCLERFQELGQPSTNVQLSGIEALYSRILAEAFKDLEEKEADMIHFCLSLLVTAQKPVSVNTYAKLHNTSAKAIREAFKSLYSVVQVPDKGCDDAPISIFHASFVDYLTSEKLQGKKWSINKRSAHCLIAEMCFTLMESGLYFGVSGAKTSYQSNENQPMPLQIEAALTYACTAWGDHVLYAGVTKPLQQKMQKFVETKRVLYWLEALSVLKNVSYAYNTLWQISKKLMPTELGPLLNNIGDFAHNFATPISHSAPHLYLSALPFYAATEQPLQALLEFPSVPIIHHSSPYRQVVSMITTQAATNCVLFSPSGKYIVSGLGDGEIQLWNTQTGQAALEPMTGHGILVTSVAFSPDGKYIVSGSYDNTIRLWDAQTGQPALDPIKGHIDSVASVAFSPDGKYIVSGSDDKTFHIQKIYHAQLASQGLLFLHDYPIQAFTLDDEGWMQNSSGNLLLWVPPYCRDGLYQNGICYIIGHIQTTKVELTNAVYHGADWLKNLLVVIKHLCLGL